MAAVPCLAPCHRRGGPTVRVYTIGADTHCAFTELATLVASTLIAKDSDENDANDAEKLIRLSRGGFTKAVHHAESFDRMVFTRRITFQRSVTGSWLPRLGCRGAMTILQSRRTRFVVATVG